MDQHVERVVQGKTETPNGTAQLQFAVKCEDNSKILARYAPNPAKEFGIKTNANGSVMKSYRYGAVHVNSDGLCNVGKRNEVMVNEIHYGVKLDDLLIPAADAVA
jgi:hypothetical protein